MKRRKDCRIAGIKKLKLRFIIFIGHSITLNMPQFITAPYIITTGKFDIHEVQLKNIPVKNDSGVSSNSHRKITNGHNKQAAKYSIPGMYHFFTFPLPTHLGPPPVQSHYY